MKQLKLILSLLMLVCFSVGNVWADEPAAVGTTLFSEDFSSYAKDAVPSGDVTTGTGRVVYGDGTVTYTCVNGGSNTKVYEENTGGGTSPEILIGKTSGSNVGSLTIAGIPSGGAKEITVSWTQNKQKLKVAASGTGYSGSSELKPSAVGTVSFDVTVADGADGTFTLTFSATGTSNVRVDDILVKVKTAGEGAAAACALPTFTPAETTFLNEVEVTIGCTTESAKVYYTLDNTDPTTSSSLYSAPFTLTSTTTVKAIAVKDGYNNSAVASATYTKVDLLTTMDAIFAKAKAVKNTATDVYITFNNWVVSGKTSNNAYVTDGTKGFLIYASSHGFNVGDVLSGTAACKVQLYNGGAEVTTLTAATSGLTVTAGGSLTPAVKTIAEVDSINTGALITIKNLKYNGTTAKLGDAVGDSITPYKTLYSAMASDFEDGKVYNVTGVYVQYKAVKEIAPRSAADIEEATVTPEPLADGFYLISEADGWNVANLTAGKKFELNSGVEYKLTTTLAVGDKIKVVKVTSNAAAAWYPDGLDNEYTVDAAHAGANKDIYFQEEYKSDWAEFGGYFWTGENTTPPATYPDTLYVWDGIGSTTAAIEKGGEAEAVQPSGTNIVVGASQKGNYCFKANKGFANAYYIGIALDEAVNAGDSIEIAYFRTSTSSSYSLGMDFSADKDNAATTYQILTTGDPQALESTGTPESKLFYVPEGVANAKYIRIYRNSGSTGLWVAKLVVKKLDPTAVPDPEIKADDLDFGTIRIEYNETSTIVEKELEVSGSLLTEAIAVTPSEHVAIAEASLPAEGGTLHLTITAGVGAFSETIVLKSGEVTKNVVISGTVKLKAAPPVLPENAFRLTFNGTGKEGTDASAVYDPNSDIFTDDCSAKVLSKDTVEKVYAGRPIEDDDSSLKFGTSDNPGTFVFTLAEAVEVDSIVVRAAQYDASASTITINKEEFTLDAGNKITKGCKITPTGAVDTISIKQIGSKRFYLRDIIVYVKQAPVTHTYTVAGVEALMGVNWDSTAVVNDMIEQSDGTYQLVKENVTLHKATNYEYKVAIDHKWHNGEAAENSVLTVEKDGIYNVTFTYNPAVPTTSAVATLIEEINIDPTAQIVGGFNSWTAQDLTLATDKKSASITLTALEAKSYEFKMLINGNYRSIEGEGGSQYTFHRGWTGAGAISGNADPNMVLVADVAGDYGVTWFFDNDSIAFTFPAPPAPTYYIKNNWGTAEWTWKETTLGTDNLYHLDNVVYGGTGVNWNDAEDDATATFVEYANLKYMDGTKAKVVTAYDTINLVLDPANDTIWAEMVSPDKTVYSVAGDSYALFYLIWEARHPWGYNDLKKQSDGTYKYTTTEVMLPPGTVELKVCKNASFAECWPAENYKLIIGEGAEYTVEVTFNPISQEVSATATKTADVNIPETLSLRGTFNDWDPVADKFVYGGYNDKGLATLTLAAGEYEFKLYDSAKDAWYGEGEEFTRELNWHRGIEHVGGDNMKVTVDVPGEYLFTFDFWTQRLTISYPAIVPAEKIAPLNGEFSINSGTGRVKFSRGNLQYNFGDNAWYTAEKQYEVLGDLNLRLGDATYNGSVDLFSWSCETSNFGLLASNKDADFTGDFVDWGQKFAEDQFDWSTLSYPEWNYLLNSRSKDGHKLWTIGALGGDTIIGLFLFPDNWTAPAGITINYAFYNIANAEGLAANSFSFEDWADMEALGAVFLPFAGQRTGYIGNKWDGSKETESANPLNGWYCWVDEVNGMGYYWLTTPQTADPNNVATVVLPGWHDDQWLAPTMWERERRRGEAVRLVLKYEKDQDPTAIDNTVIGEQVVKMLKDNQVVIIKGDKTYNAVGQRIR